MENFKYLVIVLTFSSGIICNALRNDQPSPSLWPVDPTYMYHPASYAGIMPVSPEYYYGHYADPRMSNYYYLPEPLPLPRPPVGRRRQASRRREKQSGDSPQEIYSRHSHFALSEHNQHPDGLRNEETDNRSPPPKHPSHNKGQLKKTQAHQTNLQTAPSSNVGTDVIHDKTPVQQSPPKNADHPSGNQPDSLTNLVDALKQSVTSKSAPGKSNSQVDAQTKTTVQPEQGIDWKEIAEILSEKVEFDGDNSDIDDIDVDGFIDELGDSDTELVADEITPKDWLVILERYVEILKKLPHDEKNEMKIEKALKLRAMEDELVKRGKKEYEQNDPDNAICNGMELDVLTHIYHLPAEDQLHILDVNGDGIPDFPIKTYSH